MDFSMQNKQDCQPFFKLQRTLNHYTDAGPCTAAHRQMKTLPLVIVDWAVSAATIPPACCWTIK